VADATQPEREAAQVLRQFRVVFSAVRRHFRQMESQTGVGGAQVWALSEIGRHPGISLGMLAQRMDVHQSTASNLVRQLIRRGLIAGEKQAHDRRSVALSLTAAAHALLAQTQGPPEGVLPHALRQLSPQTLASMSRDLDELIRVLQADPSQAHTPLADL
jgi:DNA-binding MarR family transcriptional regulator